MLVLQLNLLESKSALYDSNQSVMKWLNSTSPSGLLLRYCPQNTIPPIAQRYLASPVHPIRPKISHIYANRDQNTLWWRVSVSPLGDFKRVVRSWSARRGRIAVRQALKNQGYDELGKPLPDSPIPRDHPFTGSLELSMRPSSLNKPLEVIQTETDRLLAHILKLRGAHFEHAAKGNAVKRSVKASKPFTKFSKKPQKP